MKYELIEKLGLKVLHDDGNSEWPCDYVVDASDLESLLEKGVRVYFVLDSEGDVHLDGSVSRKPFPSDTHTALLIAIEPIKRECVHEPVIAQVLCGNDEVTCKHCGVELVAEWKAK